MQTPDNLRFTRTHEWVEPAGDGTFRVGITDHAQAQLGDVIFVELPQPGVNVAVGERFGTIESVKAASDLFAPVGGKVARRNDVLAERPDLINSDPYGAGWLLQIEDAGELPELLGKEEYEKLISHAGEGN